MVLAWESTCERASGGIVKKPALVGAAVVSASALVAGVLPSSAAAETKPVDGSVDPDQGLDLDTPEAAREYLRSFGISDARIESFAKGLGLTAEGYLALVAGAFSTNSVAPAPVEFVNGRIKYNNTVQATSSLSFTRTQTRVQQGTVDRVSGRCRFGDLAVGNRFGDHVVSEVVEFDPARCTRTVFDGAYDPASVDRGGELAGAAVADSGFAAMAASGPQFLPCGSLTNSPTLWQPDYDWVSGERRRYYKQSFVDPVCITITSSTLNARWKNTPNSGTNVTVMEGTKGSLFYYTDLGENWPESQKQVWLVPGTNETVTRATEVTTFLGHIRTETDFPEHLALAAALMGSAPLLVALVACQFDLSDTTFTSNQTLKLRRNGGWFATGWGDVIGGCSSLVHERVWHGSGSYAR